MRVWNPGDEVVEAFIQVVRLGGERNRLAHLLAGLDGLRKKAKF